VNDTVLELRVVIHEVHIAVPTSINLVVACIFNDKKYETQKRRRIDAATKIANFGGQELTIPIISSTDVT
jgi:hypothetical protein